MGDQSPITDPSQSVAHGSTATISPTTVVAPSAPVELLREDFDSAGFGSRGWYDYRVDPILTDTTHAPGSTRALEVHFAAGAQTPPWVAARHLFTPSPSVYVSYWVRYSANWVGSGQPYHPHEFQIMSDLDGDYDGLSNGWMEAYIEQNYQNGGKPRLSIQDSKAINTNYGTPPIDLTKVTEDRSVGGCNGLLESNVTTSCFSFPPWYNDKEINAPNVWFQPQPGPGYKSNWNHVEAYFQINSIVNGIGQADGVAQYWFNGTLVLDRHDLLFRTGARPTINFKQFVIAPYIGDGSPVDQTMWVDNLVVATAPASSSPPPPPPPPATNPGMVGDLSVSSSTDSVATLSFTEVTDGTGQPASYDVRYAAGTISWGSATSVSQGTCATPVAGTAIGAARTCTVSGLKPSTAYQFQLVAFRGTMNQNAVYGGLSNVASGTTTATIAPVATVSVSPATVTLKIGTTQQYIATLRDASGAVLTGRAVAWSSSNPLLATVNSSGLATALAAGTVTITATSESKSGSAALTVTVPKPGRVKDLAVSSHTDTSLTIAFTEVGDGTGHPASYDVRFAPGTISWGSATSVTQGTCATPLAGTTIGATKTCTILGLLASTAYQVQLVAFRGTMNVNAVYGGLSNVAGAATDSDPPPAPPPPPPPVPPPPPPAPPPPAPPPAPSGLWPNEPSGFTAVTERSFDSPAEAGWGAYGPLAIVSDPSAPKSPGGVGQVTFPAGFTGGYEPSFTAIDGFNGQGYTQFYVSFWVKISDNWQGHSSGVNKIGFVWLHGDPVVFFVPTGVGSGPLEPMIWLQNTPGGGARLPANVNNVEFTRGVWHRWEALLIVNTGDLANGEAHWWIDGVKVGEYKNIEFGTSAQSKYWGDELSWRPIWGGVDDAVTQTMYMWMDHYYASGR